MNLVKCVVFSRASQMTQVKNLPTVQEMQGMWVQSLGWKDSLEEGMATHSCIPAWRIPLAEETDRPWSIESQSWKQLSMHACGVFPYAKQIVVPFNPLKQSYFDENIGKKRFLFLYVSRHHVLIFFSEIEEMASWWLLILLFRDKLS